MHENVRKTLLRTLAGYAIKRDDALASAASERRNAAQSLHDAAESEATAQTLQAAIGQLTETWGLTEEMAAEYRRTFR